PSGYFGPSGGSGRRENRLRGLGAGRQRRLERAHVAPVIEGLAGKTHRAVDAREPLLRRARGRRGVRIGAARERILTPVDRARGRQVAPQLRRREAERI